MELNGWKGPRSFFAASQSHTGGWQPVPKTTLDIFWKDGHLKPQKCVEWSCRTLGITCSDALPLVLTAQWCEHGIDIRIPPVGMILTHHPFHRVHVLQHLGVLLSTWDLMACLIPRGPISAWHVFLKFTSILADPLRIFCCSCSTFSHH